MPTRPKGRGFTSTLLSVLRRSVLSLPKENAAECINVTLTNYVEIPIKHYIINIMVTETWQHYRRIRFVLILVLVLNWLVALAKILYGLFSRCTSMTADGFHSLSDGTSNIIGLFGIKVILNRQSTYS